MPGDPKPHRRIKLVVEFDGKPYTGWQRQAKGASVQGKLESALEKILQHRVTLHGAGRTDSGVHALGMVAHFDTPARIAANRLPRALGTELPRSIVVLSGEEVAPKFDSRRDALLRWYRYQISPSRIVHPLGPRAWYVFAPLKIDLMRKAVSHLEGNHDFRGFRASTCTAERTQLTMREASLVFSRSLIVLDFKCQSFLQRMVRLMVGAVVSVGMGKLTMKEFLQIRDEGERPNTIRSAPPEGLCLMRIAYSAEEAESILAARPDPPSF